MSGRWNVPRVPKNVTNWTWDGWTDHGLTYTTRTVTDDLGEQVIVRRCARCALWLPLDLEHFPRRGSRNRKPMHSYVCFPCNRLTMAQVRAQRSAEERHRLYAQKRNRYAYDPVAAEEDRFNKHAHYMRNRDAILGRQRDRRNSAEHADMLARRRELYAEKKRRERERERLAEVLLAQRLPARPLALALDAWAVKRGLFNGDIEQWFGVNERILFRWRVGADPTVPYGRVEGIIHAADLLWWEVYNAETVRRYARVETEWVTRRKKMRDGSMRAFKERARTRWIGDMGPDHATLRRITGAFEGPVLTVNLYVPIRGGRRLDAIVEYGEHAETMRDVGQVAA